MPLIERATTVDGILVPRSLFGDDKIRTAVREARGITERVNELLATIVRARFDSDPPDNEAVRQAVATLIPLYKDLRNLCEDLRLYTEVTPDGRAPFPEE